MRVLSHYLRWKMGLASAETQTSAAERACLARHAAGRSRLVEIGVWHGVTTCVLRSAMAEDGLLLDVDPFHAGRLGISFQRAIAHREVSAIGRGRVEWLQLTGVDAARELGKLGIASVDFIFIDGDHSYRGLRDDWKAWKDVVEPGGVIALHDSRRTPAQHDLPGSVQFTEEVIVRDPVFEVAEGIDSLTVLRKHATTLVALEKVAP